VKRRISSGYGLTLFELVIVIGFFAVFAGVFVRLFLSAHETAQTSADESHAVLAAQDAAECFKSGAQPQLYYDDAWRPAQEAGAAFCLQLETGASAGVETETITVSKAGGGALYALTVKKAGAVE
jgi:Tfp pilus assembly protein FimT